MHSSEQSDFERDRKGKTKMLSNTMKRSTAKWLRSTPEPCFRVSSGCRAHPGTDVERNVRISSVVAVFSSAVAYKEACSSSDFER